ncbi:unnamed protein product [Trifolium pratense]|uniref:Uncharacterized protein n=1 Tax=Trifolium pratense TaxID=57577 RepID=A0ACB0KNR5_TRIPR|nr:unnamed protein product [Trifolium pratense]
MNSFQGRKSLLDLAERMKVCFSTVVGSSIASCWNVLTSNSDDVRVMTRTSITAPGTLPSIVLSTRVCEDEEASQIFLDGVLEAGKKAEELLFSKGIGTNPSLVTPSKSSKAIVVVGEPSSGKSTAPKFKERPNPIKSKKRLKSDYEKARERQKFIMERKKQKREDEEALKKKSAAGEMQEQQ